MAPTARAASTTSRVFSSMPVSSMTPRTALCSAPPSEAKSFWYSTRTTAVVFGSSRTAGLLVAGRDFQSTPGVQTSGARGLELEWELRRDSCAFARGAVDAKRAAQRFDAVVEADEARSAGLVGTTDTVVPNRQQESSVTRCERDVDPGSMRVLRRVRESLRDDVVRRDLDGLGQACVRPHLERNWYRGLMSECTQRGCKSALGQDGRMDAARELLQVLDGIREPRGDSRHLCTKLPPVRRDVRLRGPQRKAQCDEPLLRAVVDVSLDAPAGLVRRSNDAPARSPQPGLAPCIRYCGRDEVSEVLEPLLGVARELLPVRDDHGTPEVALDEDRARHGAGDAPAREGVSVGDGLPVLSAHPRRALRAIDLCRREPIVQ